MGRLKTDSLTSYESYETEDLCFIDILTSMKELSVVWYATQNRRATKLRHAPNPFVLRMKHRFDKSDILVGVILEDFLPFYFCSIKIPSVNPTALSYWRLHP